MSAARSRNTTGRHRRQLMVVADESHARPRASAKLMTASSSAVETLPASSTTTNVELSMASDRPSPGRPRH